MVIAGQYKLIEAGIGGIMDAEIKDRVGTDNHVVKYKRRKGYRRKIGHRQDYTALRIDKIVVS